MNFAIIQVLKIVRYLRNLPKRIYSKTAFK